MKSSLFWPTCIVTVFSPGLLLAHHAEDLPLTPGSSNANESAATTSQTPPADPERQRETVGMATAQAKRYLSSNAQLVSTQAAATLRAASEADKPEETAPPPQGKIHLVAEAPPRERRTYHMHDGFYLRANVGYGLTFGGFDDSGTQNADVDVSGSGLGIDLLVGGTPSPGFVVGGGVVSNFNFLSEFESDDGDTQDADMQSTIVGVFVDGFPQATGGWHLGGMIGFALVSVAEDATVDESTGFGGAIWAGYDEWVGDDFAVGGLLRFSAARTTGEDEPLDVAASHGNLTLMFSALYH